MKARRFTTSCAVAPAFAMAPVEVSLSDGALSLQTDSAFAAKGGNGNGGNGGKGGKGGNGSQGGKGGKSASAASAGKSAATGAGKSVNKLGKQIGQARAQFARDWAARFGNLNAFRASQKAFANASATSNVGRIAAYNAARTGLASQASTLTAEIDAATAALDGYGLDAAEISALSGMTAAEIDAAIAAGEVTVNPNVTGAQIEAALNSLATAQTDLSGLQETAQTAFEDAAKKEASAEVQAELDKQLDLQHGSQNSE